MVRVETISTLIAVDTSSKSGVPSAEYYLADTRVATRIRSTAYAPMSTPELAKLLASI